MSDIILSHSVCSLNASLRA